MQNNFEERKEKILKQTLKTTAADLSKKTSEGQSKKTSEEPSNQQPSKIKLDLEDKSQFKFTTNFNGQPRVVTTPNGTFYEMTPLGNLLSPGGTLLPPPTGWPVLVGSGNSGGGNTNAPIQQPVIWGFSPQPAQSTLLRLEHNPFESNFSSARSQPAAVDSNELGNVAARSLIEMASSSHQGSDSGSGEAIAPSESSSVDDDVDINGSSTTDTENDNDDISEDSSTANYSNIINQNQSPQDHSTLKIPSSPSNSSNSRRNSLKTLSPKQRREIQLERNRKAAQRSREKKKLLVEQWERDLERLTNENQKLEREEAWLLEQIKALESK